MTYCLIVEDNQVSRKVFEAHLKQLQLETDIAFDGEHALSKCLECLPDVILLDWHMPKMNGLDFLRHLRELPGGEKPIVVMCTCDDGALDQHKLLEQGISGYLTKPTYFQDLVDQFRELNIISKDFEIPTVSS